VGRRRTGVTGTHVALEAAIANSAPLQSGGVIKGASYADVMNVLQGFKAAQRAAAPEPRSWPLERVMGPWSSLG